MDDFFFVRPLLFRSLLFFLCFLPTAVHPAPQNTFKIAVSLTRDTANALSASVTRLLCKNDACVCGQCLAFVFYHKCVQKEGGGGD